MNCHGEAKAKWLHCPSFSRGTDCLSDPTGELHLSFLIGVRENANSLSLSFERHVSILSPFSKTKSQNQIRGVRLVIMGEIWFAYILNLVPSI